MNKKIVLFRVSWIFLAVIGVAILFFGLIAAIFPGPSDPLSMRAIGVASIGMGLFGFMITITAFRNRERWSWFILWYYPVFWIVHFFGRLPPSQDQVHQILFTVLSIIALLICIDNFFPQAGRR